jgi:peroxiredoxin
MADLAPQGCASMPAMLALHVLTAAVLTLAAGPPPAWDFELYDLGDRLVDLEEVRSAAGAQLVAVDFFQVDCAPCKAALPEWIRAHHELAARGLRVVVVAVPGPDAPGVARERLGAWFERSPTPFPVVFDKYGEVARRYGVAQGDSVKVPQVFLLGRDGQLVERSDDHRAVLKVARQRLPPSR